MDQKLHGSPTLGVTEGHPAEDSDASDPRVGPAAKAGAAGHPAQKAFSRDSDATPCTGRRATDQPLPALGSSTCCVVLGKNLTFQSPGFLYTKFLF